MIKMSTLYIAGSLAEKTDIKILMDLNITDLV